MNFVAINNILLGLGVGPYIIGVARNKVFESRDKCTCLALLLGVVARDDGSGLRAPANTLCHNSTSAGKDNISSRLGCVVGDVGHLRRRNGNCTGRIDGLLIITGAQTHNDDTESSQ